MNEVRRRRRRDRGEDKEEDPEIQYIKKLLLDISSWEHNPDMKTDLESLDHFLSDSFCKVIGAALEARKFVVDNKDSSEKDTQVTLKFDELSTQIRKEVVSHVTKVFSDRIYSDRNSVDFFKEKYRKEIEAIRDSNEAFRKAYDISSRNREEESSRLLKIDIENKFRLKIDTLTSQIDELKVMLKLTESTFNSLQQRYTELEKINGEIIEELAETKLKVFFDVIIIILITIQLDFFFSLFLIQYCRFNKLLSLKKLRAIIITIIIIIIMGRNLPLADLRYQLQVEVRLELLEALMRAL